MSSLSDLFKKHGKASNADIEWLHLLLSDWQLVADLVFADLVLWIPTSEGSFVAAGHYDPAILTPRSRRVGVEQVMRHHDQPATDAVPAFRQDEAVK